MGFLLLFDLTNEQSFLNVRNWISKCWGFPGPALLPEWLHVVSLAENSSRPRLWRVRSSAYRCRWLTFPASFSPLRPGSYHLSAGGPSLSSQEGSEEPKAEPTWCRSLNRELSPPELGHHLSSWSLGTEQVMSRAIPHPEPGWVLTKLLGSLNLQTHSRTSLFPFTFIFHSAVKPSIFFLTS